MDSDTHRDQGEADAYWRRRVYVLAGGITAIGLVAWACSGPDHKKSTAQVRNAAATAGTATAAATPGATPAAVPAATVTVTVTPSAPPSPQRRSGDRCDEQDVVVALTPDKQVFQDKDRPHFRMSVVNTGRRSCTFDVGGRALRLRITSGSDPVWSSDHCSADAASSLQLLRRGIPYIADLTWDRKRCDGESRALPGVYVITVKAPGVRTGRQAFRLR